MMSKGMLLSLSIVTILLLRHTSAIAAPPVLSDVATDIFGRVRAVTYSEAISYCESQGGHLPTQRDFAELAMSMGAVGIRETDYPGVSEGDPRVDAEFHKMINSGFIAIVKGRSVAEAVVDFYYNPTGYTCADRLGRYCQLALWSASEYLEGGGTTKIFSSDDGRFWATFETNRCAVLCVMSK